MKFKDLFKESKIEIIKESKKVTEVFKEDEKPETLLRSKGFKIRSIFGTKFGTEFLMMKKYPEKDIRELLKDYTIKVDGESIFIEK